MRLLPSLAVSTILIPFLAIAEEGIKTVPVRDNMHMLISPMGGNVVVASGEDGTFIVDDQLSGQSDKVKAAIKAAAGKEARFVLNTHYHFDHTGGNEAFGADGAIIVAHNNVRKRLSTKQFVTYFKKEMAPLAKEGLPVVTFGEGVTLHYNNDDMHIIHVPAAHTDGDAIVHFANSNVIAAGDIVFNGPYPFIDTEHGGSIKGVIAAVDVMLKLADDSTVIAPGHGPLMNKKELQAYRDMLATIAGRIERAIKAGRTLEETIATKPTAEFDAAQGDGIVPPDAFVTILYHNLKG